MGVGRLFQGDYMKIRDDMTKKQKVEYIFTYYKWRILGVCAGVGLIFFLIVHFAFPDKEPLFSCALINQRIDYDRDDELELDFSNYSGIDLDRLDIDSDYNISYPGHEIEDANTGIFDKFFIKYSNGEYDAMITSVDFAGYCQQMGAEYTDISEYDTGNLPLYEENGISGIDITQTKIIDKLNISDGDKLLLVFPAEGKNHESCQKFLSYLLDM